MNLAKETNNSKIWSSSNEEISFNFLYNFFKRNKKFISFFSLIFLLFGLIYSFKAKRVWEGEFQIVVKNKDKMSNLSLMNPMLAELLGDGQRSDLKTEVGILESPSILMPIFDFVVLKRNLNLEKNVPFFPRWKKNSLSFTNWKKNLDIELQKDTTILNIAYRDTDKDLILSVLNRISEIYQDYAGENKLRLQKIMSDFLSKQIQIYKEETSNSLKAAQEFAIEQDLIYFDNQNLNEDVEDGDKVKRNVLLNSDIENIRVQAANRLRKINLQLTKIKDLGLDEEKLKYIGSTIPKLVEEGLPAELIKIDNELIENRLKYTENDFVIQKILENRRLLIINIRDRAIGYLNAEKIEVEALMEAAMRPKGILLKYKELVRAAQRDENTLIALENEKRLIDIEMAKREDPWKLITKPTLLKDPVSPSKLFLSIASLILGSILASLGAAYKERKSDKIYESAVLEDLFSTDIIESLDSNKLDVTNENVSLLKDYVRSKPNLKNIFLISVGDISSEYLITIRDLLKDKIERKIEFSILEKSNNFEKIEETDLKIVVASLGNLTFTDIQIMRKKLKIYNIKLSGIILISPKS